MFPFNLFGFSVTLNMAKYFLIALVAAFFLWVYPNTDKIQEFFGMETKASLSKQVKEQSQQLEQLKKTNADMKTSLDKCEAINKLNLDAVSEQCAKEKLIVSTTDQYEADRLKALQELLKKIQADKSAKVTQKVITATQSGPVEPANKISDVTGFPEEAADAVSAIQLESIWKVYCRGNPTDQCKTEIGAEK